MFNFFTLSESLLRNEETYFQKISILRKISKQINKYDFRKTIKISNKKKTLRYLIILDNLQLLNFKETQKKN